MSTLAAEPIVEPPSAWWLRLHQRFMPDYNRKATLYWWTVVLLGALVLMHSLRHLVALPGTAWLHVVGCTLLAMLAGLVPVRIPRSTNSFTAGEIFIFLLLLLHGPEAAALASACEALVGSVRASKRWTSRIGSPAMAALAMFSAGSALQAVLGALRAHGLDNDALLLLSAIIFALGYFVLNTLLATMVPRLKRNERIGLRDFIDSFGWLGVAYVGNASVATFLYLSFRQSGIVVVIAAAPIIVILLTTGHFFFRREEAAETERKAREQQAAQRQLLENARHAGMAEIATNVLHNVGNVLNSVNVSAELIADKVRDSEAAGLARAVKLLDEHADHIGEYLSNDPRGRLLPGYLAQLVLVLAEERRSIADELAVLTKSVKHIKEIVATQQSYAGASSIVESAQICELLEDALRIDTGVPGYCEVTVQRRFSPVPALMLDKHRVLLILVNLISNARHAMQRVPNASHELGLSVETLGEATLRVIVSDTGEGIAPDNLTRIFAHGFTTKQDGHGFGLHSCVLAAREMGGSLAAHSDGPGRGAAFTLELPLQTASTETLMNTIQNRRILLVDDMPTIHDDFRKILVPSAPAKSALDAAKAALFGDEPKPLAAPFELDSAHQGQEGLAKVVESVRAERPYAMAFVDMRMPPGWDGVETIERLWQADPRLQVVICTAYSDTSWEEVLERLDAGDRLLILKKPFDNIEVRQLASALAMKWDMTQQAALQIDRLEQAVGERTLSLKQSNEALQTEISERKQLEAQLVQSEKLASIGQLAAGVAHEINNPIGYIFSNFGTLEKYLADLFEMLAAYEAAEAGVASPQLATALKILRERVQLEFLKEDVPGLMQESKEGIARVRQIVQDLKDFSRVDSGQEWLLADLHKGIDSTLNIVASEVRYKADVVKEYGAVPEVECMASQINQVIMNLVVNAAHAIGPERGCITIRTGCDGDEAWFEVSDTGCGIAPQNLSRIFDPFFTTKPIGQGTGLGLSLSYGVVQKHGGRIDVRSELGKGSSFRVVLPVRRVECVV